MRKFTLIRKIRRDSKFKLRARQNSKRWLKKQASRKFFYQHRLLKFCHQNISPWSKFLPELLHMIRKLLSKNLKKFKIVVFYMPVMDPTMSEGSDLLMLVSLLLELQLCPKLKKRNKKARKIKNNSKEKWRNCSQTLPCLSRKNCKRCQNSIKKEWCEWRKETWASWWTTTSKLVMHALLLPSHRNTQVQFVASWSSLDNQLPLWSQLFKLTKFWQLVQCFKPTHWPKWTWLTWSTPKSKWDLLEYWLRSIFTTFPMPSLWKTFPM